jgi:hypothetical protein
MEIVNGNLAINGYDLNRSAGLGVIGGVAVLVLTIVVVLLVSRLYREQKGKWRWLPAVAFSVFGMAVAVALALPALLDHYIWHDRVGQVQSYHVGYSGIEGPEGGTSYLFSFERMTEAGPPAYFYRCIGGDCATMGKTMGTTKPITAHCHTVLWQSVWRWVPLEECTVRVQ